MKIYTKYTISLAAMIALSATSNAAVIASESFNYPTAGYNSGLENLNGGTGFSNGWSELDNSNVGNGVFGQSVSSGSDAEIAGIGNHARVQLATSGLGIGRNFNTVIGTDNSTAWLSFRMQNNNTDLAEQFAVFYTTNGTSRSTRFGATKTSAGQSDTDGQFDLANGSSSADILARDTSDHFYVVRFDFGAADSDTVTVFADPTSSTNFSGSGSGQITGVDATFTGIGMTATGATMKIDEIYLGDTLFDVTSIPVPEPSSTALLGLGGLALILRRRK